MIPAGDSADVRICRIRVKDAKESGKSSWENAALYVNVHTCGTC
jgi:hypothetical protein